MDFGRPTYRQDIGKPNSYVRSNTINNYTKDFNFLWDEIILPITYDSDWREANKWHEGLREE
ncbi:MAG: mechanosensitive ion channel family protein [Methanotrichaceae archaeon]|nr:mechanosensitive ion channel family protein [Methanotrichaceae archaeon]